MGNAASSGSASGTAVAPQRKSGEALREHQPQPGSAEQQPPEPFWKATFSDPVAFWTLWLALATTALWYFTYRLWSATKTLAEDAKTSGAHQAEKMERSVAAAGKSATAMERVAESMATNAGHMAQSVKIMGENAEVQRTFGMMNMRAYIDVLIGGALYQTAQVRFEARPVIKNTGNTPARNISWRIAADILPVPLPDDFAFPLPEEGWGSNILGSLQDGSMAAVVPQRVNDDEVAAIKTGHPKALYVWGAVTYEDMFGEPRLTEFAQLLYWQRSGDMREDGFIPEIVLGNHLTKHNRTT